jgi:O-antigen biosynthesis protein WbqV
MAVPAFSGKRLLVITHDLMVTAGALYLAAALQLPAPLFQDKAAALAVFVATFSALAGFVYVGFALYAAKWRFASLPDLVTIIKAVLVLALVLVGVMVGQRMGLLPIPAFITPGLLVVYVFAQVVLLAGPRIAYRAYRAWRERRNPARTARHLLFAGAPGDVAGLISASEAGAFGKRRVYGILSPRPGDRGDVVRGFPVLGLLDDAPMVLAAARQSGVQIGRILMSDNINSRTAGIAALIGAARREGIPLARSGAGVGQALSFSDGAAGLVQLEELLLRPAREIDPAPLKALLGGTTAMVTGAGGSIGAVIARRLATLGVQHLILVDHSEVALHAVMSDMEAENLPLRLHPFIADIRDAARLGEVMAAARPDFVFHAAALKHVPHLERDVYEGVLTNVIGTFNAARAAREHGARAFVLISTDKATEPTSVLGLTKRMAELIVQALDRDRSAGAARFVAVRFGNVLGTSGSVLPFFLRQIERGGPVTITHPDMVRYFMTAREAADLVLAAATHAAADKMRRAAIYVLDMGEEVNILTLATRLIALAGHEPGVDIEIRQIGIRPGERLNEQVFSLGESAIDIDMPGMTAAAPKDLPLAAVMQAVEALRGRGTGITKADVAAILGDLEAASTAPQRVPRSAANDA